MPEETKVSFIGRISMIIYMKSILEFDIQYGCSTNGDHFSEGHSCPFESMLSPAKCLNFFFNRKNYRFIILTFVLPWHLVSYWLVDCVPLLFRLAFVAKQSNVRLLCLFT